MKALATGASSGIGRDIARELAKRNIDLIIVSIDEEKLKEVKNSISNVEIEVIAKDLSNAENCKELYEQVKDKHVDILINNAGFGVFGDFTETSLEKEVNMINTNVVAMHILTKLFLQDMKNKRKEAERDANILDGRLKCLRGEEEKTLKKIEVTRRKTELKRENVAQKEEKQKQKLDFKLRKQQELELRRQQIKDQQENRKLELMMKQEEKKRQMDEDLRNLREQKKNNEELRKYIQIEDLSNKKTQADYIKSQHIIAEEKRRAIELEKKNKIKAELERKIAEEEERIQNAENKKAMLEDEEIEIMKKIRTTTQIHEQLIENYEKIGKKD
jgi:hypothetical protein